MGKNDRIRCSNLGKNHRIKCSNVEKNHRIKCSYLEKKYRVKYSNTGGEDRKHIIESEYFHIHIKYRIDITLLIE